MTTAAPYGFRERSLGCTALVRVSGAAVIGAAVSGIAAGGGAALAGTTILGLSTTLSAVAIGVGSFAISLGLSVLSSALAPEPPSLDAGAFGQQRQLGDRQRQVRQPITERRMLYGEARVSGPILFVESTNDNDNLHMVIAVADHEVDGFGAVYLDDYPIYADELDSEGWVHGDNKYADLVRIRFLHGEDDQAADSVLVSETKATDDYRFRGIAAIYVRFDYDRDKFPTGIPNVSAWVRGKRVTDPRDSTVKWTPNPSLCIRDYLLTAEEFGGLGARVDEIDDGETNTSANVCEEFVDTQAKDFTATTVDASGDYIEYDRRLAELVTGDRVEVSSTGSVPGGLSASTDYYVIVQRRKRTKDGAKPRIQLASTYANALSQTAVDITSGGSGTITVTKTGEPRYSLNGTVKYDTEPFQVLQDMASSFAGSIVHVGDTWKLFAGAYRTPSLHLDEDDARGSITLKTKHPRDERFNAVKGVYAPEIEDGVPTDYPVWTNSAFKSQDNGVRLWGEEDLPYTNRPHTAQRIAKIKLNRHRQEMRVSYPATMRALQVQPGDAVELSNTRFGWDKKVFEVTGWQMVVERGENDVPTFGVDLELRETASTVYDWNSGEETQVDPAPDTNLPNPFTVLPPGQPSVDEQLYSTRDSAGVKVRALLTATASDDAFVRGYQFRYKKTTDSKYVTLGEVNDPSDQIDDIDPGTYEFGVRTINSIGVRSDWQTFSPQVIYGLLAAPSAITGLTIQGVSSLATLRWDQHPDLDVRIGGRIQFRHSSAQSGATWQTSVSIGEAVNGNVSEAVLPLKPGTYLARAVDSSGKKGPVATVSTAAGKVQPFANVDLIQAHPNFSGTDNNTVADETRTPTALKLTGTGLFDDIPDFDEVNSLDSYGGVTLSGTYTFASGIDLGGVQNIRLESEIKAVIANVLDKIDTRTEPIDTWDDFDGNEAASGDAQIWVRSTDDDPSGTPTWSAWERLDVGEYQARAFQFQARLKVADPAYNIFVEEAGVSADQVA